MSCNPHFLGIKANSAQSTKQISLESVKTRWQPAQKWHESRNPDSCVCLPNTWFLGNHVVIDWSYQQSQVRWRCQLTPLTSAIHRKVMPSTSLNEVSKHVALSHLVDEPKPMLFQLSKNTLPLRAHLSMMLLGRVRARSAT